MHLGVAAAALGAAAGLLALMGLTATGQWRRSHSLVLSLAAGLFFPVTWAVWYLWDERPYRSPRRT